MTAEPINAEQLAIRTNVNGKSLRAIIRRKRLVPGHPHGAHYELLPEDIARICADVDVRSLLGFRAPR